jgi:predicted metal-dependent hydrolase
MTTSCQQISVSGIEIEVARKPVKNLYMGVYPPDGQVRVTAPLHIGDEAVRLAAIDKLTWIKRQQSKFQVQPRQSLREMVSGESHYFMGQRYLLQVVERKGKNQIFQQSNSVLVLYVKPGTSNQKRREILQQWYRSQLRAIIPPLLDKCSQSVGVEVAEWGIRKMRTKWGSCNIEAHRVWLNLELAKKPLHCLEYIIVHELAHLLERNHNDRFKAILDRVMPHWRFYRDELNQLPLGD